MRLRAKILLCLIPVCLLLAGIAVWAETSATYNYDEMHRLESIMYGDGTVIFYGYDENGNRIPRHLENPPYEPDNGSSIPDANYVNLSWTGGDPDPGDSVTKRNPSH